MDEGTTSGGCEPQGCGLNGAWLGQKVHFRELHLNSSIPNTQGFRIAAFKAQDGHFLTMNVDDDKVSGTGFYGEFPKTLNGSELNGSTILLKNPESTTYTLTIQKVIEDGSFWTECDSAVPGGCTNVPKTRLYQFSATDGQGNCVEVCKPGMADNYNTLNGTAVIFKGDLYGDDFTVRSVDGLTASTQIGAAESDVFNIACVGTSLSKLYFLRHTSASTDPANKTTVKQRQSLLQLLAGDYCGNGHSFTEDGHAINLDYKHQSTLKLNAKAGLASALSVDAMWKGDGTGASCLGTPRLSDVPNSVPADFNGTLVDYIKSKCPLKQFGTCGVGQLDNARNGDFGSDYAISANAFQ